ncbi:polyprotein [Phytophthora megakarya]|uniref:Polyprotein n=1 Tax=Phytophthora megakarya TaxID=4795 RepID=A0A225VWX5_9STRA|nr:polyprotein [Phytophthora megakarya]
MSPTPIGPNDVLRDDNYFLWEALAVLVKLLGPTYQSMVREATSAIQAWGTLRGFFVKQNLHNRVQLRKQLHEFAMAAGDPARPRQPLKILEPDAAPHAIR